MDRGTRNFDPPLWLQRQTWLLEMLRMNRVDSVLDVGCGEGKLLSHLANAAFQLDEFPVERFPRLVAGAPSSWKPSAFGTATPSAASLASSPQGASSMAAMRSFAASTSLSGASSGLAHAPITASNLANKLRPLLPSSHWIYGAPPLVLNKLVGLDTDAVELVHAQNAIAFAAQRPGPRWMPLRVELLEGGIEKYDARLGGVDAIVSTEVIEHLHEPVLEQFAPMILGRYQPRLFLLTTPNYSFNAHFENGVNGQEANGIPDPTGRTTRRFRHPDHKFEWTPSEFATYCEGVAADYGYDVEISGLGELLGQTTIADDSPMRYSTQTALFRRNDGRNAGGVRRGSAGPSSGSFSMERGRASGLRDTVLRSGVGSPGGIVIDDASTLDGATSASSEEMDMDAASRRSRMARSRQPSHLPWLSSPTTSPDGVQDRSPSATAKAETQPEETDRPHRSAWREKFPCHSHALPPADAVATGARKTARGGSLSTRGQSTSSSRAKSRRPTSAQADDVIIAAVLDFLCYAGEPGPVEIAALGSAGAAALSSGATHEDEPTPKEACAKLWDVWVDDAVRSACGGRVTALLDALRLVAPTGEEMRECDVPDAAWLVGSDGREWKLCVAVEGATPGAVRETHAQELWLAFSGAEVAKWAVKADSEEEENTIEEEEEERREYDEPEQTEEPEEQEGQSTYDAGREGRERAPTLTRTSTSTAQQWSGVPAAPPSAEDPSGWA